MIKNKKILEMVICFLVLVGGGIVAYFSYSKSINYEEPKKTIETKYKGDVETWAKEIIGKKIQIRDGGIWAGDTYVKELDKENENKVEGDTIADCYTDESHTLILELSNGEKIKIENIGKVITSHSEQCTVTFYDYKKEVIKRETVKRGESATAPEVKKRKGYYFKKWDKQFTNVTDKLDVYAVYEKNPQIMEFSVDNSEIEKEQETAVVNIRVKNNKGILGMILQVNYDQTHLTLLDAQNGEAVKNYLTLTTGKKFVSGCKFVWDGVQLPEGKVKDGIILSLKFKVNKAKGGDKYKVKLKVKEGNVVNSKLLPIENVVTNGSVKVI